VAFWFLTIKVFPARQIGPRFGQRGKMSVIAIENVREFPARARGAFVTIGNFDGVHRGHQSLLAQLRAKADAASVPAVAITFDPHPVALLRPEKAPVPLVWPEREIALLYEAGATEVAVFRTGPWLLELSARDFFDRVICGQLQARGIVEGPNFAFGHDRLGDVTILKSWCAEAEIDFAVVEPTVIDDRLVSSSLIRQCLNEGRVQDATRYLGRPHRIRGRVDHGSGRGAGLGFPTANLGAIDALVPLEGVYAGLAWVNGVAPPWPAACNIGPNPTFGEMARKVEAHLVGFAGDLYGKTIELDFLERLRGTQRFSGLDELLRQIQADIARTSEVISQFSA
jgi:riboflavin kinase / FMN adenylyltransferase